jgi:hypothetical protein
MTDDLEILRKKYQNALAEIDKLRQENARLKQTAISPISTSVIKPKVKVHQPALATSIRFRLFSVKILPGNVLCSAVFTTG